MSEPSTSGPVSTGSGSVSTGSGPAPSVVVDSFGDVTGEYLSARERAAVHPGPLGSVDVVGSDAIGFLQGLVSQDVAALEPGVASRSFLLSPQGKLVALLWLVRLGDETVRIVTEHADVVASTLRRYRIRVAADIELGPRISEVIGPEAGQVAADGIEAPLGPLPRRFVPADVGRRLIEDGVPPIGRLAHDALRVEAGEPRMGIDVDERTIPQETGLVPDAVSFTKGCYLGQELVARIDSRGHVNRHLRAVAIATNVLPPSGAEVVSAEGKVVGTLGTVAESLAARAPVALALLRREVAPGDAVAVRWSVGAPGAGDDRPVGSGEEAEGSSSTGSVSGIVHAVPMDVFDAIRAGSTDV